MAEHESPRTTKLYDGTGDEIPLDEVEGITSAMRSTTRPSYWRRKVPTWLIGQSSTETTLTTETSNRVRTQAKMLLSPTGGT
jgi:hypothetical protein